ncbi:hypothetical protein ETB97_009676, partial [Aspergillus alliaceus]
MYDSKRLSALLCLFLTAGPASVLSVPVAKYADKNKDYGIVSRQINSEAEAGSNWDISIPDGPSYTSGAYGSSSYHENPGKNGGSSFSSGADASDDTTIAIPDGPSVKMGNFAHYSYEETEPVPETFPTPTPTPKAPEPSPPPTKVPVQPILPP